MSGDKYHVFADHIVRGGNRLLGIASIVSDDQIELPAKHPALGVDVGHRHFGATRHLLAQSGVRAGDRSDDCDRYALRSDAASAERERRRQDDGMDNSVHETAPSHSMSLRTL